MSAYLDRPARSLDGYLNELIDELGQGPLTEERATELARRIRAVEAELAWKQGAGAQDPLCRALAARGGEIDG